MGKNQKKQLDLVKGTFVSLGHTVGLQVQEWMAQNDIHDANHAFRLLCSLGMSAMPDLAVMSVERKLAYDKMRAWLIKRTYEFQQTLDYELKQMERDIAYLKLNEDKSNASDQG